MKMKYSIKLLLISSLLLFSWACARIPVQSVQLMDRIMQVGERMHKLNIAFADKMFAEKRAKIDEFIRKEYTPKFVEEFGKRIPEGVDVRKELQGITGSMVPRINERRDAMQRALEGNRIKVMDKLLEDYRVYEHACAELRRLLSSSAKVDSRRRDLTDKIKARTSIDFERLGGSIDGFITDAGNLEQNIGALNGSVTELLK